MKKVQVWLYGLKESDLQVLLLKTCPGRGDFWQPVTGGVEEGESFEEAALREVLEETGIVATPQKLTALSSFEFDGKWGRAFEQAFGLEVPARLVGKRVELDAREHTDYAWVEADKALEKTHFESNRKILSELILKTNK